jgi:hypothetical protein
MAAQRHEPALWRRIAFRSFRGGCACRGVGAPALDAKAGDLLEPPFVEQLEFFLAQPADGIAVFVSHHYADRDFVAVHAEDGLGVV